MISQRELQLIQDRLDLAKQIEIEMLQRGGNVSAMQKLMQQDIETLLEEVKQLRNEQAGY